MNRTIDTLQESNLAALAQRYLPYAASIALLLTPACKKKAGEETETPSVEANAEAGADASADTDANEEGEDSAEEGEEGTEDDNKNEEGDEGTSASANASAKVGPKQNPTADANANANSNPGGVVQDLPDLDAGGSVDASADTQEPEEPAMPLVVGSGIDFNYETVAYPGGPVPDYVLNYKYVEIKGAYNCVAGAPTGPVAEKYGFGPVTVKQEVIDGENRVTFERPFDWIQAEREYIVTLVDSFRADEEGNPDGDRITMINGEFPGDTDGEPYEIVQNLDFICEYQAERVDKELNPEKYQDEEQSGEGEAAQ